eukprot:gene8048-10904_t
MLFGSSITQRSFNIDHCGWGAALSNWYARSADVLNRGASGYNSRWLRQHLTESIGCIKPDLSIVFIGNNDSIDSSRPQHVNIEEYSANIYAILDQLYSVKATMSIILISTTRVNPLKAHHSDIQRAQYADVLRTIIQTKDSHPLLMNKKLAFVDLWTNDPDKGYYSITEEDLCDHLHLGKTGNKKVFDSIRNCINNNFPLLSPDNIPKLLKKKKVKSSHNYNNSNNNNDIITTAQSFQLMRMMFENAYQNQNNNNYYNSNNNNNHTNHHKISKKRPIEEPLQLTVPLWSDLANH